MSFGGAPPTTMASSVEFFQSKGVLITGNAVTVHGRPGDWMGIDLDGDGVGDRAAMFLAYEQGLNRVWTVIGESRNTVAVGAIPLHQVAQMATVEGLLY